MTYQPHARSVVIVPTYNERENLPALVAEIGCHIDTDILVVDDNSPDGTGRLAQALAAENGRLRTLLRPCRAGLGRAYTAGIDWALERGYELVFHMDSDFSHAPADLPRLAEACRASDLAIGSRYVAGGGIRGWGLRRRVLSRAANLYVSTLLGRGTRDWTSGFRGYRAALLARIGVRTVKSSGYAFLVEMAWRAHCAGGRLAEVPITFVDRVAGRSKLGLGDIFEAVQRVPRLALERPTPPADAP